MSHIHLPDGVLPVGWWLLGFVATAIILCLAIKNLERADVQQKIPYLGVAAALMLITMSIPLGFLPMHINLTVLMGILVGPALGFIAVFIVNLFLSFLGHGGITSVGLNTLILGLEVGIGAFLFQRLKRQLKPVLAAGTVTVITLLLSTTVMFGVIGLSSAGWQYALPHAHHTHDGDVHYVGCCPHHETVAVDSHQQHSAEDFTVRLAQVSFFNTTGISALLIILFIGITLEVLVTTLLVKFFQKVKPNLLP